MKQNLRTLSNALIKLRPNLKRLVTYVILTQILYLQMIYLFFSLLGIRISTT